MELQGFQANQDFFAEAHAATTTAAQHYEALREPHLTREVAGLREHDAFRGGHGLTGYYQGQLANFGIQWLEMFDHFVKDEEDFAIFLTGLAARIDGTASLYREVDARNAERFNKIAMGLDEGDAG